jgi:predicted porin
VQFATTSAQWGGIATHASDIDNVGNSFRINNSVKYTSPELYGFRFGGLYGFSNSTATTSVGTTAVLSTGASYHYGALKLGAAYFYAKKPADQFADGHYVANTTGAAIGAAGPWSYVGHPDNVQTIAGAATYVIGNATLGALYSRVKFEKANGTTSNVRFDDYDVSLNYAVTPATKVGIGYLYTVGHVDYLAATPKYHRIVVGADYKLSKRTDVYAVVSAQQSAGDAKGADLYQGVAGTMSSSNRQVGVRFAIIHRF